MLDTGRGISHDTGDRYGQVGGNIGDRVLAACVGGEGVSVHGHYGDGLVIVCVQGEGEGEGETPDLKVEVTIAAPEAGSFAYAGDKLAFKLQVTSVKVNNEPFELPVTTFSFDLAKAK